jgi:hypothetical protein
MEKVSEARSRPPSPASSFFFFLSVPICDRPTVVTPPPACPHPPRHTHTHTHTHTGHTPPLPAMGQVRSGEGERQGEGGGRARRGAPNLATPPSSAHPAPFPSLTRPLPAQAMSFGLTQYDVEELIDYCGGKCESGKGVERESEGGAETQRELFPPPPPPPTTPLSHSFCPSLSEPTHPSFFSLSSPLSPRPPPPLQSTRPRSRPCTAASGPWTGGARAS